jgi:hypothetical protein
MSKTGTFPPLLSPHTPGNKGYRWKKGQSGNPSGNPKGYREISQLARSRSAEAMEKLLKLTNDVDSRVPASGIVGGLFALRAMAKLGIARLLWAGWGVLFILYFGSTTWVAHRSDGNNPLTSLLRGFGVCRVYLGWVRSRPVHGVPFARDDPRAAYVSASAVVVLAALSVSMLIPEQAGH